MNITQVAEYSNRIVRIELETLEEFESLVFLEGDNTRFLTQEFTPPWRREPPPRNLNRSLGDILDRMESKKWTINSIKNELSEFIIEKESYPTWIHDPKWFRTCFEPNQLQPLKFGSLLLRRINADEKSRAPKSVYTIQDGCHRALSLAAAFRSGLSFETISGLILEYE